MCLILMGPCVCEFSVDTKRLQAFANLPKRAVFVRIPLLHAKPTYAGPSIRSSQDGIRQVITVSVQ